MRSLLCMLSLLGEWSRLMSMLWAGIGRRDGIGIEDALVDLGGGRKR